MSLRLRLQRNLRFEEVMYTPTEIRAADGPQPSPAEAAAVPSARYARLFGNERQDSRVDVPLPSLDWKVEWRRDLDGRFDPACILDGGDRLFVQAGSWRILDATGQQQLSREGLRSGIGRAMIAEGLAHLPDANGLISAYSMADGQRSFVAMVAMGETHARPFIARRGSALIAAGVELPRGAHATELPKGSFLQRLELGDPIEADASGMLTSTKTDLVLHVDRQPLLAAMHGDTVVLALPGHLIHVRVTNGLEVVSVFTDEAINPVSLSIDEALRAYVVVDTGPTTPRALWVVNAQGRVVSSTPLPTDLLTAIQPTLVGRDHRMFVVAKERIVALDPTGKVIFQRVPSGRLGGAVVTGDGQLVVAEGDRVMRFGLDHDHRLVQLEGDVVCTPPTLTPEGRIYVASRQTLYCLTPR